MYARSDIKLTGDKPGQVVRYRTELKKRPPCAWSVSTKGSVGILMVNKDISSTQADNSIAERLSKCGCIL
ncbi:MAG TPA: hypothetical protein VLX91_13525 [Candidatus Acidoferrales bacterium]|nr:hypothetical protein [Candidatus Acidoferrales bacterium]